MLLRLNHRACTFFLWVVIVVFASCKDKSTAPIDEFVLPEILGIEVLPNDAKTGDTLSFRLILSIVENQSEYQVSWQIADLQGEITDTLSQETELQWIAPPDTGTYYHSVQLIAEDIQNQSELSSFSVHIGIRKNPYEMIVFSGITESNSIYQIYSFNLTTGELTQLTDFDRSSIHPVWNPFGTAIAFTTNYHPQYIWPEFSLWMMDSIGNNKEALFSNDGFEILGFYPDWSADGKNIAIEYCPSCEVGLFNYTIYNYSITSRTMEKVVENGFPNNIPSWSNKGDQIAHISGRDYVNEDTLRWRSELYVSTLSTGESNRITNTGNILYPVWNPVEPIIAVRINAFETTGIYLVNIETGDKVLIIEDISEEFQFFPSSWSTNGEKLLVIKSNYNTGVSTLCKIDIKTSSMIEILTWKGSNTEHSILGADWYQPQK